MSEDLANSIVKAPQITHKKEVLREMVPLCHLIKRHECPRENNEQAHRQCDVIANFRFKDCLFNNMADALTFSAQEGYLLYKFLDEGIMEKMSTDYCESDRSVEYSECKIIALYQKAN